MKANSTQLNRLRRAVRGTLGALVIGALGNLAAPCQAAPFDSPVGTWDFVIKGGERGVAFITFYDDHTLDGIEIIAPRNRKTFIGSNSRSDGDTGRVPDVVSTNGFSSTNVLYGTYGLVGQWNYDSEGRVIGYFPELGERYDGTSTNTVTNAVSFVAKVVAGKRMTVAGSSGVGKVIFRGVPFTGVPDISGSWYGQTKREGQLFNEFFDVFALSSVSFYVVGSGPGYEFDGVALVSSQRQIGFNTGLTGITNTVARSVVGPFNPSKSKGKMKGSEDPKLSVTLKIGRIP